MARPPSQRQIEKNARVRQQLLKAALRVVGKVGYGKASIAKIAEGAKVSTGTFYLHFASKEQLYAELLPWANIAVTRFIEEWLGDPSCYMDFEEKNIRGFFDYLASNQAFVTVLIEAEVATPEAWRKYIAVREKLYLERLEQAWENGEFPDYERNQLPQISDMLLGARKNIVIRYSNPKQTSDEELERAIRTYLEFVLGALHRSNAPQIAKLWRSPQRPKRRRGTKPEQALASA